MDIRKATWGFEKWMATHTRLVKADLIFKHRLETESPFLFLRGTFYRWVQLWKEVCAGLAAAQECWPSAICISKISALGATSKGVSSGE